ncbi:YihY/virulence factor BrkB family protein [Haladaptatus halobius]|uniref:YihY/virulence factor BrkB family protein n=1 Tax=Haladaptatus halobius TaxID=2884875 RepID=UPI001D0AD634|nr:YihY/virulence factor BrkB family protein [Haladaptatus halobius]
MSPSVQNGITVAQSVRTEIQEKQVTFLAGSIAYHAFISLLPLLLLAFLVFAAIGSNNLQTQVITFARSLSPAIGELAKTTLASEQGRASASIVGILTLMWGALKLFRGLDTAFSEIYAAEIDESILDQVRDGLIVLFAIGFAVVATIIAGTLLALFPAVPFIELLNPIVLIMALTIAFFPMYYLFPGVETTPRGVLPGTIFAAVGWTALQGLFQIYVQVVGSSASGILGAVLLLVTWLYFSGLVLLIGAVLNAVLAKWTETTDKKTETWYRSLTYDEAARYVRLFREQVFGRYERMVAREIPIDESFLNSITERPATIELIEKTTQTDDGNQYEIRVRWIESTDEHGE